MKNKMVYIIMLLGIMMSFLPLNLMSANGQDTDSAQEDEIAEQYIMPLLQALQYGDKDQIYEKWVEADREQTKEKEEIFDHLIAVWDGREAISVKRIGKTKRPSQGKTPSGITYQYEATCTYDTVKVEITICDSDQKMDWINIRATPKVTGTLSTWREFNHVQWLMTGVAIVEILFSLFMAYHCIKRKPRLWGLWLALILLVYGGAAFSTIGGLKLTFYIYTLRFPKLLKVQGLGIKIYFSLPIGAIVYYVKKGRKKL